MGGKQTKPMLDVHVVQQRRQWRLNRLIERLREGTIVALSGCCSILSHAAFSLRCFLCSSFCPPVPRSELGYLKNLFVYLVQSSGGSSSSRHPSSAHLNQSVASSVLASPSNMDLMSLRLPKASVVTFLLLPSFPGLSSSLSDRFFQIFDYNGYGTALDWSEYIVMMYTLWYGHPHEELSRFFFALFDVNGSGRVGKKEYRKVAQTLLEEYACKPVSAPPPASSKDRSSASSSASANGGSSGSSDSSREHLTSLFDFYFHLALFLHDRDHDRFLSPNEFAHFAEEDLLLNALVHGRKDPRHAKQRVRELLGARADQLLPTADTATTVSQATAAASSSSSSSKQKKLASTPTTSNASSGQLSHHLTRSFLGGEEAEETSGVIWRQQRRSAIKQQVRRNSLAMHTSTNTNLAVPK